MPIRGDVYSRRIQRDMVHLIVWTEVVSFSTSDGSSPCTRVYIRGGRCRWVSNRSGFWPVLSGTCLQIPTNRSSDLSRPMCWLCCKPSDQPRDAARREECSDLDEKSLTTFCCWDERAKGSDWDHLNDFMRLKWTTQNDALVEDRQREYPLIQQDHDVAVCPIPGMYVELQDLQFNDVAMTWQFTTSGYAEVWLQ